MSRYDYQIRLDQALELVKNYMQRADNIGCCEDEIDAAIGLVYRAAEEAEEKLKKIKEASNEF